MYRQNFRSPTPSGSEGGPRPFRSPPPYSGPPLLPPPPPAWGYGSPHTPAYGHRAPWPHGSGGGGGGQVSPSSHSPYGGRYPSPDNTPPRRPSPRYTSPYSNSPGGNAPHHYHQHGRGFSPRQSPHYQGSPRTSSPYGAPHGRGKRVSDVENYYRPSMLEDPWANLQPLSLSDLDKQKSNDQTTYTVKKGRYFS